MKCCTLLALLCSAGRTLAIAPPHPDTLSNDGTIQHIIANMNTSRLIHPNICKGLSSQECDTWEDEMHHNARRLQDISITSGYLRPLVLLVRFKDHANRKLPPREEYVSLFNGVGVSDAAPTGSISEWFNQNSYNQVQIEAKVIDWKLTNNTESHFASDSSGMPVSGLTHDFRFSMYPVLDQLFHEGFDFSKVDVNNDGLIDNIIIMHSGYPAEIGGRDCDMGTTSEKRIWAHAVAFQTNQWTAPDGSYQANGYSVSSALRGVCNGGIARLGITTHELMHTFGLPDLNDISSEGIGRGLGNWDIMSNPHGNNGAGTYPGHLSVWSKYTLGWIKPTSITKNGLYKIKASELIDDFYIIDSLYPQGEYLLIENRQPLSWDNLLGTGGILIYHIDDKIITKQSARGYPGQSGWPGNGKHYQVALLQGDRRFALENGYSYGDNGDYWKDGMKLGVGPLDSTATNFSLYPNTNAYQSGIIKKTGLRIFDFSATNTTMTFRVGGFPSSQTRPTSTPTSMPSVSVTRTSPDSSGVPVSTPTRLTRRPTRIDAYKNIKRLSGGRGGASGRSSSGS